MKYQVYKSLDRTPVYFGIRSGYLSVALLGLFVAGFVALVFTSLIAGFVGLLVFLAGAVAVYFAVMSLQEKLTESELPKKIDSYQIPHYLRLTSASALNLMQPEDAGKEKTGK